MLRTAKGYEKRKFPYYYHEASDKGREEIESPSHLEDCIYHQGIKAQHVGACGQHIEIESGSSEIILWVVGNSEFIGSYYHFLTLQTGIKLLSY